MFLIKMIWLCFLAAGVSSQNLSGFTYPTSDDLWHFQKWQGDAAIDWIPQTDVPVKIAEIDWETRVMWSKAELTDLTDIRFDIEFEIDRQTGADAFPIFVAPKNVISPVTSTEAQRQQGLALDFTGVALVPSPYFSDTVKTVLSTSTNPPKNIFEAQTIAGPVACLEMYNSSVIFSMLFLPGDRLSANLILANGTKKELAVDVDISGIKSLGPLILGISARNGQYLSVVTLKSINAITTATTSTSTTSTSTTDIPTPTTQAITTTDSSTLTSPAMPSSLSTSAAPPTSTVDGMVTAATFAPSQSHYVLQASGSCHIEGELFLPKLDKTLKSNPWPKELDMVTSAEFLEMREVVTPGLEMLFNSTGLFVEVKVTILKVSPGSFLEDYAVALRSLTQLSDEEIELKVQERITELQAKGQSVPGFDLKQQTSSQFTIGSVQVISSPTNVKNVATTGKTINQTKNEGSCVSRFTTLGIFAVISCIFHFLYFGY